MLIHKGEQLLFERRIEFDCDELELCKNFAELLITWQELERRNVGWGRRRVRGPEG